MSDSHPSLAVIIPCLNEESTVQQVIRDLQREVPGAALHVFDNGSTDRTRELALEAGALVTTVREQGKGRVLRQAFSSVVADFYATIDGDLTYPARAVKNLYDLALASRAEMVVANRLKDREKDAFHPLHLLGNQLLSSGLALLFGTEKFDVLSGLRVLSSEFARTNALDSKGFDIETELSIRALLRGAKILQLPIRYLPRPARSHSKIRTISDGLLILKRAAGLLLGSAGKKRPLDEAGSNAAHSSSSSNVDTVRP